MVASKHSKKRKEADKVDLLIERMTPALELTENELKIEKGVRE